MRLKSYLRLHLPRKSKSPYREDSYSKRRIFYIQAALSTLQQNLCSYAHTRICLAFCKRASLSVPVSEGGISPTQVDMKYSANP